MIVIMELPRVSWVESPRRAIAFFLRSMDRASACHCWGLLVKVSNLLATTVVPMIQSRCDVEVGSWCAIDLCKLETWMNST
jgi:hypothetical protein